MTIQQSPCFNIVINKEYNLSERDIVLDLNKKHTLNIRKLNAIRSVYKKQKIQSLSEYFELILEQLNLSNPIWQYFLSKKQRENYTNYIKSEIADTLLITTEYFFESFVDRLKLFRCLKPINYNNELLDVPVYNHDSVTGRLTITNGHNFLTMKKDKRQDLVTPYEDHTLLEIDFSSCEPYFYLSFLEKISNETDVYSLVRKDLNINSDITRDKLKRSVISILYGAANKTVKRLSGLKIEQIKDIRNYLKITEFESKLRKEFDDIGFIKNFYGRPILSDANLVNYWVQSSAVDFCCLAFYQMLKGNDFLKAHAVIHDAIIVSCPNDKINDLNSMKFLREEVSNFNVPIKIKPLKEDN